MKKTPRNIKLYAILPMSKVMVQQTETRKDTRLQQTSAEGNSVVVPIWTEFSKPCKKHRQQRSTLHGNKWMH